MSRVQLVIAACGIAGACGGGAAALGHLGASALAGTAGLSPMVLAALAGGIGLGVLTAPAALLASARARAYMHSLVDAAVKGETTWIPSPAWLRPIARAADAASHRWAERCEELRAQVRESQIQHRVAESERAHTEAILHALNDAVVVSDAFCEVTLANDAAAELFGFDVSEAAGRSIDRVIPNERVSEMIRELVSGGVAGRRKREELTLTPADEPERQRQYDLSLTCLPGPASEGVGGVVMILRDVTRENEISQMKSDFVSQASHELRTPLSSINAYIEMLIDGEAESEEDRREFYSIIKGEAERVSRLVDNMLNISRIEAGIQTADRTETDFVKVAEEVVETLSAQARLKEIALSCKFGPLVYTAEADRDMMHQVVMNLVSNGIKYTPEGGRVTIHIENDDTSRSVLVTVADTGLGIPPESKAKIFDKFYRVENYKRVAKGTGLGLNLVKHIVETVHQGRVGVESEVGMGSKFWFAVPYTAEQAETGRMGMAA